MQIVGLDFTSAPTQTKPLIMAVGHMERNQLTLQMIHRWHTFELLEAWLGQSPHCVAGFDCALGLPLRFLQNFEWETDWAQMIARVRALGKTEFVRAVREYSRVRAKGDRYHFRHTDKLAGAQSPMQMDYIPVGKMFYEGATRLETFGANLPAHRVTASACTVVEVYPALFVRALTGVKGGYKSEQNPAHGFNQRAHLLEQLTMGAARFYDVEIHLSEADQACCLADHKGDTLDAVLAMIQAAWAYQQRDHNYGIPTTIPRAEGWIVDPAVLKAYTTG